MRSLNRAMVGFAAVAFVSSMIAGCGALTILNSKYPYQIKDTEGNPIFFEDLQEITTDPDMLPEDMIDALRELGLQDDDLIAIIVEDGLPTELPTDEGNGATEGEGEGGNGEGANGSTGDTTATETP